MKPAFLALLFLVAATAAPAATTPLPLPEDLPREAAPAQGLPSGRIELAGVTWDLTGSALRVDNKVMTEVRTQREGTNWALDLPVGRKAATLHFLHSLEPGPLVEAYRDQVLASTRAGTDRPDYPHLFTYELHYEDGGIIDIDVRMREGIESRVRRTFHPAQRFIGDLPWARVAWTGPLHYERDERDVVYAMQVPNPRPDATLETIRVWSGFDAWGTAHVYAVSTSEDPLPGSLYFVAPHGSDDNPGTWSQPWASFEKAAATLRAGDTVLARRGTYSIDRIISPHHSGEDGRWITFSGFPGETARIDALRISNHKTVAANHMTLDNGEPVTTIASRAGAFQIYRKHHIRVQNLLIEEAPMAGIIVDAYDIISRPRPPVAPGSHHIDVLFNRVYRSREMGIGIYGYIPYYDLDDERMVVEHVRVIGNEVLYAYNRQHFLRSAHTNPSGKIRTGNPTVQQARRMARPFGDECLDLHSVRHFEVAHNEVAWGEKEGIDIQEGTRHGRVHHNYVHHHFRDRSFPGGKIGIYVDTRKDEEHVEIDHNVVEANGTGIQIYNEDGSRGAHMQIHHNLALSNHWNGISVNANAQGEHAVHHIDVFNNTAVGNGLPAWDNTTPQGGISMGVNQRLHDNTAHHNIAAGNRDYQIGMNAASYAGVQTVVNSNIVFRHNLSGPALPGARVDEDRVVPVVGEHGVVGDPMFVDPASYNFSLRPGSPGLGAGEDGADLGAYPRPETP